MAHVFTNVNITTLFIYFFLNWISSEIGCIKICQEQKTCGKCMTADPRCEWCFQVFSNNITEFDRCDEKSQLRKHGCSEEYITNHKSMFEHLKNDNFSSGGDTFENSVQLRPQKVSLKLRPNVPYTFEGTFQLAKDYPVDLYYLMDLSFTMGDDKHTLASLGKKIADDMSKITKNFRLGFGSFVDKLILPFTLHNNESLVASCKHYKYECVPPYSFKNHLSLTTDTDLFSDSVNKAKISGNLDGPEGGFDAIMQAIVCENEIGWRNKSRRILLYSSDETFHFAGDGKLAGIVQPHDGLCHLDKDNVYSYGNKQDYPSISFLNYKLSEKKVVVIFAVSKELETYRSLVTKIEGAVAGQLSEDSSNVVDLIRETYKNISSALILNHKAPKGVDVVLTSTCSGYSNNMGLKCNSIGIGQKIPFSVTVTITDKGFKPGVFVINPVGLNEQLEVSLDIFNKCDCERNDVPNSNYCSNGGGKTSCGICICNPDRLGSRCECEKNKNDEKDTKPCTQANSTQICSGKGQCKCSRCLCTTRDNPNEIISGKFCECENFSCLKRNDMMCSGHGECVCNKCNCHKGWKGDFCEISTDTAACINEETKEICSGNGACDCLYEKCKCKCTKECPSGKLYFGELCDQCQTVIEKECNRILKLCATCEVTSLRENKTKECHEDCFKYEIEDVKKIENPTQFVEADRLCRYRDDSNCEYTIIIEDFLANNSTEGANRKRIKRLKVCYPPPNALAIGLGVSLGILFLGILLLLLWKLITFFYDRKEYAKFEQERRNAKFDKGENPIYKRAVTSFKNPAYAN